MASIFTRIIGGEIPCYKIAEDDRYFAFLDINPLARGCHFYQKDLPGSPARYKSWNDYISKNPDRIASGNFREKH